MNHHHHPPPVRPPIAHKSAAQIFKNAARFFISHPLTFIFIVSLVFNFRYNVENGARYLISFVDSDPSLKSLISRLDLSGHHHYQQHRHQLNIRRRRRAFLHLSRVGTLDEDFFSGDADYERSLFNPTTKPQPNGTFLHLSNPNFSLGFSNPNSLILVKTHDPNEFKVMPNCRCGGSRGGLCGGATLEEEDGVRLCGGSADVSSVPSSDSLVKCRSMRIPPLQGVIPALPPPPTTLLCRLNLLQGGKDLSSTSWQGRRP